MPAKSTRHQFINSRERICTEAAICDVPDESAHMAKRKFIESESSLSYAYNESIPISEVLDIKKIG